MDLQRYGRAIRRNWWIVVLVALLGLLGGVIQTARTPNLYAATVTFYVSSPQLDANNSFSADQFAQDRANSYAELLSSQRFADLVRDNADVDLSGTEIANRIVGTAKVDTVLVEARIEDTELSRLRRIQRTVSSDFPDFIGTIETSDTVALRVVSTPPVSTAPVSPRTGVNLVIGLAAGVVLGLLIATLRELVDTSVRNGLELEELAEVPLIGNIANDPVTRRSPVVTTTENSHTRRAEDFRQLRTNLEFVHSAQRVQVIAVTSSVAGEGKSSTALNIAATAAERGDSVLLVDADLRRPQIADYLGFDRTVGLTTVLTGRVDAGIAIREWGEHGLSVLASGVTPPNPSELLNSAAMLQLMAELRGRYDLIVIDTPPVLAVTDAAVCSTFVDGFVMVYRYGKTRRTNFAAALHGLRSVEARIVGVVMNMRPRRGIDGAGYDSYESYGISGKAAKPGKPAKAGRSSTATRLSTVNEAATEGEPTKTVKPAKAHKSASADKPAKVTTGPAVPAAGGDQRWKQRSEAVMSRLFPLEAPAATTEPAADETTDATNPTEVFARVVDSDDADFGAVTVVEVDDDAADLYAASADGLPGLFDNDDSDDSDDSDDADGADGAVEADDSTDADDDAGAPDAATSDSTTGRGNRSGARSNARRQRSERERRRRQRADQNRRSERGRGTS